MLVALLTLLAFGVAGLLLFAMTMALLGVMLSAVFGLAALLVTKVLPVLVIGWVAVKLLRRRRPHRGELSAADQRWLDS